MKFATGILEIGVNRVEGDYLRSKVRLCNQIALFLFVLGTIYACVSLVYFPILATLPGGAAAVALLAFALNGMGIHRLSRFLIGIGAVSLDSLYHAYLVPEGEPFIIPLYLAAFSFGLYPWILIDVREKYLLGACVTVCFSWFAGQHLANDFFETTVDNTFFRDGWLNPATYFFALSIALSCLWFLQRQNIIMERERDAALGHIAQDYHNEQVSRLAAEETKTLLERQLLQAQKMEAVGRLAGGIAHDLNNLLSPVIGYAEILQEELVAPPHRWFAGNILDAGNRSKELVGQLLAFSRQQTLELRTVDMNELISEFFKLLRRTIREDIQIETVLAPDLPLTTVDPCRFEQILMNLCVNAQDAMPNGGTITIETRGVTLDEHYPDKHWDCRSGDYVVISVADEGIGIKPEDIPNIFDPFFTTKGPEGTGLGLATVFGIAKQHGGDVSVYSEEEKGTAFKVYLPVAEQAKDASRQSPIISEKQFGDETILLVEDHEDVRALTETMLGRLGYQAIATSDVEEALEIVATSKEPIHLLLTDVVMPKMNGKALFLAAHEIQPSLKCLYMSGYNNNVISRFGTLDKGVHFIQKPFGIGALAKKLRAAIDDSAAPTSTGKDGPASS